MSLRSTLTTLLAPLSNVLPARVPATWLGGLVAVGLMAVSSTGCGGCNGDSSLSCDPSGEHCQICDAYGCRPATVTGGTGGTSTGGASASSSSSTSTSTSSSGTGGTGTGGATTGTGGADGGAPCDPTKATCACDNGQCPTGLSCISGLCITGCNFTYECGSGNVCANGACVPGCTVSSGCAAGLTCTNGACLPDTTNPQCSASNPCPSGQVCGPNGVCGAGCTSDAQCASGDICDGTNHVCVTNPSPKPVCSSSTPCPAPEVCLADGFCHYPCTTVTECQHIDNRFVACVTGYCETQEEVNPQCTLTMPCPAGKSCISNLCL